jgi:hypothetical protein
MLDANKFKVLPLHTGELLPGVGGVGKGVVATVTDCTAGRQLFVSVTDTV